MQFFVDLPVILTLTLMSAIGRGFRIQNSNSKLLFVFFRRYNNMKTHIILLSSAQHWPKNQVCANIDLMSEKT